MRTPRSFRFQILDNIDHTASVIDTADGNKIVFTGAPAEAGWKRGQLEPQHYSPAQHPRQRIEIKKRKEDTNV